MPRSYEAPPVPEGIRERYSANGNNASNGEVVELHGRTGKKLDLPKMDEAAYRGVFGELTEIIDPHTEGSKAGVLLTGLTCFGNAAGRGAYFLIGATKHHCNLFAVLVGKSSKARKGSTWDPVKEIMLASDRQWFEPAKTSGLSSGEGLINEVRDPVKVPDSDGGEKIVHHGAEDKRALVVEGELAQGLKVMKREGNTLSPVLRNAWDGATLKTMVKNDPLKATDPHISIVGHATKADLIKHLTETEMANGLGNRFIWFSVERSKLLPEGGEWHTVDLAPVTRNIVHALNFCRQEFRMTWAEDARPLWHEAYAMLAQDRPGMFGAITARAEAQTLRLAMIYALADCSREIRRPHLESALAVWEYAEESARLIFGNSVGDPDADKVLAELQQFSEGLTRTEVSDVLGRNKNPEEINRIRSTLADAGLIRVTRARGERGKKPVEKWQVTE